MPSPMLKGFSNLIEGVASLWNGRSIYPAVSDEIEHRRPIHPNTARDFLDLLPQPRFFQAVSDCRWLCVSSDIVNGALLQKADYVSASDWVTHFTGKDRAWGDMAEEKCEQLDRYCCTRGDRYPWRKLWWLTIPHLGTDGGIFLNLTETDTGWPLVQPIEAQRVATRGEKSVVGSGSAQSWQRAEGGKLQKISTPYAGLKIISGIIYDFSGKEVAYRVLGDADDGSEDTDISAQDMIHLADPRWFSEGRPLPEVAASSLALQDIHLGRQAQLVKHIHSSRQIGIQENESGTPPAARRLADPLATRTPLGTSTQLVEEGNFTFVKRGDKVTPWDTKTPGGEWMAYDDKIVASALHAIGWRIEMLDPSGLKGANTRGFADQINTTILAAFNARKDAVRRVRQWQIAKLIQRGDLPASDEWWKWGVTPPPEFSPDPGRAITSELEAVRSGAQSMPHLHRRWGMRPGDVLNEQADYILLKREIAAEKGLTEDEVVQLGTLAKPGDAPPPSENQAQAGQKTEANAQMTAMLDARHSEILAALRTPQSAPSVNFGDRAIVMESPVHVHPVVVPAPVVNVAPPVINVAPAEAHLSAPITVQAAAPLVVPPAAVHITIPKAGNRTLVRDPATGRYTGIKEE